MFIDASFDVVLSMCYEDIVVFDNVNYDFCVIVCMS